MIYFILKNVRLYNNTFRKTFFRLISFPGILALLVLYLILTCFCTKGDTGKLQNRNQEIAIHPEYKKNEFSCKGSVSIESILLPKMMWEQDVK